MSSPTEKALFAVLNRRKTAESISPGSLGGGLGLGGSLNGMPMPPAAPAALPLRPTKPPTNLPGGSSAAEMSSGCASKG